MHMHQAGIASGVDVPWYQQVAVSDSLPAACAILALVTSAIALPASS
jgi:hypothetical protein